MPQVTNRRLMGQMAASPVGKGTVYNSMLKVTATNRERAAKVNTSETQRLQKITKVIDKDLRYSGWKSNKDIDKTKNTLKQLEAFQRVLKEDYPVQHFSGTSSHHGESTESNVIVSRHQDQQGPANFTQESALKPIPRGQTADSNDDKEEEKAHENLLVKSSGSVTTKLDSEEMDSKFDVHVKFSDRVKFPSGILGEKHSLSNTKCESRQGVSLMGIPKPKPSNDSHQQYPQQSNRHQGENTTTIVTEKERHLEAKRQARKERVTQRIYTRGFDMKTLQWEIDRQIKLADPERERKKLQRQLLSESRDNVDRLITRNRLQFNNVVMGPKVSPMSSDVTLPAPLSSPSPDVAAQRSTSIQTVIHPEAKAEGQKGTIADPTGEIVGQTEQPMPSKPDPCSEQEKISLNPLLHKVPLF